MIEIRTADYSKLENILNLADKFNLRVGLGSECCVHKLPGLDILKNTISHVANLTVVTPITPQKHYKWMLDYINELPSGVNLVINDAGILYSLNKTKSLGKFDKIIAGRGIVHTSEACPWVDHLLRDESEHIKEAFLQTNLNYSRTLDFFKKMGMTGMETDLESRTVNAALKTGLPVSAHIEYIAVSYARSCHTSRFYKEQPPECVHRCNNPIELELIDMFDLSSVPPGFAQPSPEMMEIFPHLYLLGNTIFMKSNCQDTKGLEQVIINADMYDIEGLTNKILSIK
jgi:hypothetical protein